jgi:hypothetical protein
VKTTFLMPEDAIRVRDQGHEQNAVDQPGTERQQPTPFHAHHGTNFDTSDPVSVP